MAIQQINNYCKQIQISNFFRKMLRNIVLSILAIYWVALGAWAVSVARKAFHKYQNYSEISPLDPKLLGLVRNDYDKWDKPRIIVGCFTLFPLRVLFFITMIFGCLVFALLLKLFGPRTLINSLFTFYLNTYGKLLTRVMCTVQEEFQGKSILTPIVISNHTNWFDIFFLTMGYAPLSFVSKAEVRKWPVIGILARARQCVFVDRDSEEGRKQTKDQIKQRIEEINRLAKNKFPLVIFPEGTTSNGKALLTFKNGAFDNMSSITAFCLKYECQNFSLGMDELNQAEHAVFMMSQLPKLIVKRVVFTPAMEENAQQYEDRIRNKMAEVLAIPCTEGGFRDRLELIRIRKEKAH